MKYFYLILTIIALMTTSCCESNKGVSGVEHVVMIGLDGLASNTIEPAEMPTLKQMMAEGAWTLQARSILPSSSACNWASMFMGVGPEMHGYNTWGSKKPDFPSIELGEWGIFPSFVGALRNHNPEMEIGAMYEWETIECLFEKDAANLYKNIPADKETFSENITKEYIKYLKEAKPNFSMVIYNSPDYEGHTYGWGSEDYYKGLTRLDGYIARIVEATKEAGTYDNTIFMIVSDHGGINKGHGSTSMAEMETPVIIFGRGVKKGYQIKSSVVRYDTAPTITHIFGAKNPDVWRGKAIEEIFE